MLVADGGYFVRMDNLYHALIVDQVMLSSTPPTIIRIDLLSFLTWFGSLVQPWVSIKCSRVLSRRPGTKILVGHDVLSITIFFSSEKGGINGVTVHKFLSYFDCGNSKIDYF